MALNHITIMGRLVADPDLRKTQNGTSVTSFRVAVDRDYTPEGGEKQTDFIDCVAWRQRGDFVARNFTKGQPILVEGRLQMRPWQDKDGNKRIAAEVNADNVYFCGYKKGQENASAAPGAIADIDVDDGELPWETGDDDLPL